MSKRAINKDAKGRQPPQAVEVVGTELLEKHALSNIIDILKPEHLYSYLHLDIYKSILFLFKKDSPADVLTVSNVEICARIIAERDECSIDKRAVLSGLLEAGSIQRDTGIVFFLYRPEHYDIKEYEEGNLIDGLGQVITAKHSNGSLRNVNLRLMGKYVHAYLYSILIIKLYVYLYSYL